MAFKYESVVPWGRLYQEYVDMFNISESDLEKRILGCGDGPASFNKILTQAGGKVISIDPIYQYTTEEIENRIDETYQNVINQTRQNQDKFVWTKIKNVEELGSIRMKAMNDFLTDYETGKKEGRYMYAELPILPFTNNQFDISLSSHFLFLYTDNLSLDFHIVSIKEMLRVSNEVRIFPILDLNANQSMYLDKVVEKFNDKLYVSEIIKVNYEFQKDGNKMLKISKR